MKLKVFQNSIGNFNFLNPSQKSFNFSMGIIDESGKIIEENGVRAMISYSGEPEDEGYFESPINNMGEIVEKCYKYTFSI